MSNIHLQRIKKFYVNWNPYVHFKHHFLFNGNIPSYDILYFTFTIMEGVHKMTKKLDPFKYLNIL